MLKPLHEGATILGSPDSGAYFKYMAQFVEFTDRDAEYIKQSKPYIEKHVPEIVDKFYAHLLRYPPTRKFFLKKDGSIDQDYLELRMRHQANFWLRTADGVFDDEYARYLDYVGKAHTSRGADPRIYIAERYVIGQVGFMSHAIAEALTKELRHIDEDFELCAIEAWNKAMMIILELLARAYGTEREAEDFDPILPDDTSLDQTVEELSEKAFDLEQNKDKTVPRRSVPVAHVEDIPEGQRKIVTVDGMSIGVFHHDGKFYALRNQCLHRGGPVCTGTLEGNTLTCPWHGFQYNVTNGALLADPRAHLDTYPVEIEDGHIDLLVPDMSAAPQPKDVPSPILEGAGPAAAAVAPAATDSVAPQTAAAAPSVPAPAAAAPAVSTLKENEFRVDELQPGQAKLVALDEEGVAVYNVGGTFFATADGCTHRNGPLSEGDLDGKIITCPLHGSRFDVTTGEVVRGPATRPVQTYRVTVENGIGRVSKS